MTIATASTDYFFGIPLSTHLVRSGNNKVATFPYEALIAAISILFFRISVHGNYERKALRWFFAIMLAFLAYSRKSYELICAVELFSYAVPFLLQSEFPKKVLDKYYVPTEKDSLLFKSILLVLVGCSALLSFCICRMVASGTLLHGLTIVTPSFTIAAIKFMFPITEMQEAYNVLYQFASEKNLLQSQLSHLFFVTFHIQCGMGFLGIAFLTLEQNRRNQLIRMDMQNESDDYSDDQTSAATTSTPTKGSNNNDNDSNNTSSTNGDKTLSKTTTTTAAATTTTTTTISISSSGLANSNGLEASKLNKRLDRAHRFQKTAAPFIFFIAVPYMVQIIGYGNINAFAFACFKDDLHRTIRLYDLFEHDNNLVAMANHSPKSPAAYADYMSAVVSTAYDIFNRKLFSLPKVLLLPSIMARQPRLMAQLFPIIFFTDWLKGRAIAFMTNRIEALEKETQELTAIRNKVESFDIKNAELLQRAGTGAIEFTSHRWEELTVQIQIKSVVKDLTARTKAFFSWIERNFVFSVLVDCALAQLIAVGKIVAAEIFVFSRAIEDAVDMALMRSRSEAELARMMTNIDELQDLFQVWEESKTRNMLPCHLGKGTGSESMIILRNLHYSRGTATVRAVHIELGAGVYALTGANGSGKSTLFRVLMSCSTNEKTIDLPSSIVLSSPSSPLVEEDDIERETSCEADMEDSSEENCDTDTANESQDSLHIVPRLSITMPSSQVVEISQSFYWPLYAKPIDWIFQDYIHENSKAKVYNSRVRRVAEELQSLSFTQVVTETESKTKLDSGTSSSPPTMDAINIIMKDLTEEKEDWFSDLSGGQKSKVELVRKVFLHEKCPDVLLVDETMAPLDPTSKSLVMTKLKKFCSGSVVIVIYHTDVGKEQQEETGQLVECVPSNDFFDYNIHLEHSAINLRPVC